jgi:hypothetical protein
MALRKMEYGSERKFVVDGPLSLPGSSQPDCDRHSAGFRASPLASPIAGAARSQHPVVGVLACGVALYALFTKASRDTQGVAIWDIANAFTFIWIVAGMMSNPKRLLDWFDNLSMVP